MFAAFDLVRVISLSHRLDRRREMTKELARFGVAPMFFDAVKPLARGPFYSVGAHGCYLSHLALLEMGRSILIIEDDCDFASSAGSYQVPPCDIFYGGFHCPAGNPETGDIIGSHLMGYTAETAMRLAAYLKQRYREGISIDGAIVRFRRDNPDLRCVFKQLGHQRPSQSDVGLPRWQNRIPLVSQLRKVKRQLSRV